MRYGKIRSGTDEVSLVNFKVKKSELDDWRKKASTLDISLSELIRQAVRAYGCD